MFWGFLWRGTTSLFVPQDNSRPPQLFHLSLTRALHHGTGCLICVFSSQRSNSHRFLLQRSHHAYSVGKTFSRYPPKQPRRPSVDCTLCESRCCFCRQQTLPVSLWSIWSTLVCCCPNPQLPPVNEVSPTQTRRRPILLRILWLGLGSGQTHKAFNFGLYVQDWGGCHLLEISEAQDGLPLQHQSRVQSSVRLAKRSLVAQTPSHRTPPTTSGFDPSPRRKWRGQSSRPKVSPQTPLITLLQNIYMLGTISPENVLKRVP